MPDSSLSIAMIASEAVPFAKTGGLADVLGALPLALAGQGHLVTVFLPRYRGAAAGSVADRFDVSLDGRTLGAEFREHRVSEGVRAILIDVPALYDRENLYGKGNDDYPDNDFRFAFLAKSSLEFAARSMAKIDVVHSHDWQGGLVPVYLRAMYGSAPPFAATATVFTIHNLAYQGLFPASAVPSLDLGWDLYRVEGIEYWGKISFLKAGINFSDVITTVSPTYAREIQSPEYGFGFDGILRRRSRDLVGILNGIDDEQWDPSTDAALPVPYSCADPGGKREAKRALLQAFDMPVSDSAIARPLVGMVSRLVDQKGFDLVGSVVSQLLEEDAAYVLLGSGDPVYEDQWKALARDHPDRVGARIGFDDRLAHLIEGGADIFLMPSRFEPCGLNQMYSLRYGAVPVVRATGGLEDTVENYQPRTGQGTGFKFTSYTGRALLRALRCAFELYRKPDAWRTLQLEGMKRDFSWGASARKYVEVYRRVLARRRGM